LPKPSVIDRPLKVADMICISKGGSHGVGNPEVWVEKEPKKVGRF
jgi:hypothetical protein